MSEIDEKLLKLAEKFHPDDLEWRVMKARPWGKNDIWVQVFPYVTARAIHQRLDDVLGPTNWCNTPQSVSHVANRRDGQQVLSVQVGISIRVGGEWLTKFNVSEATAVEPGKGAFSGAEKRAGEEWGIGRYLYLLGLQDAEVVLENPGKGTGWKWGETPEKVGRKEEFWWKPPRLPAWALPGNTPVTAAELSALKKHWVKKLAPNEKNPSILIERFRQLVVSMFGTCPVDHETGWTVEMLAQVRKRIDDTKDPSGPSPTVPFDE